MLPDPIRRLVRIVLPLVAIAIIVAGLWPQPSTPPSEAQRVAALASNIRCPFCGGESIADAPSQIARDLEVIVAEQVADGMSDDEVYAYFEARYGEAALMDPPLAGWGWVLWAAPLAMFIGGVIAIGRRRRTPAALVIDVPPELERQRLQDQLQQIARDLSELDDQVAAHELDEATRFDLAAAYDAEASPLRARLAVLDALGSRAPVPRPSATGEDGTAAVPDRSGPGIRRSLLGAGILVVGVLVVSLAVIRLADDGSGAIEVPTPPPIDLSTVTIEELENVVARNPDIIGMRLALAELYMNQGDVQNAVVHFGEVLDRERHPQALAWLGYISFQVGELDVARNYLEEAIEIEPTFAQAEWWLANVLFYGFEDQAGAVPHLEAVLALEGVPEEIQTDAAEMLQIAGGNG